jgi:hypothetical protein
MRLARRGAARLGLISAGGMPRIIPYETVLAEMTARGFRCHYYNGGAFGFAGAAGEQVRYLGWVGPEDPTLRPAAGRARRTSAGACG